MKQTNNHIEEILLDTVSKLKVPEGKGKTKIWETIKPKESKLIKLSFIRRIAASIVVFAITLSSIYFLSNTKIENNSYDVQTVLLPDGSTISLNTESNIAYNTFFWKVSRKVYLNGEAFFKVKKGEKFTVKTNLGDVKVLGTSFNVQLRNNELYVACATGKVAVTIGNDNLELLPGELIESKNGNREQKTTIAKEKIGSWQNGEFHFTNQPLIHVLRELERQFGIQITYKEDNTLFYTGYFNKKDLKEALQLVCIPLGLTFNISNNKILIKQSEK